MFVKLVSGVIINANYITSIQRYKEVEYLKYHGRRYPITHTINIDGHSWYAIEEDMKNIMKCIDLYEDNKEN